MVILSIFPFNVPFSMLAQFRRSPRIADRHSVLSCAISVFKPFFFTSSFTHNSNQDFLGLPYQYYHPSYDPSLSLTTLCLFIKLVKKNIRLLLNVALEMNYAVVVVD